MNLRLKFKSRPTSVLGLSLEHGRLGAVLLHAKEGAGAGRTAAGDLSMDLLTADVALVGREIANHLEAAGLRERRCVVAVPADWVISLCTAVPAAAREDVDGLLQIAAEKGFPSDLRYLHVARMPLASATTTYVTQLAVRRDRLDRLHEVAKAAGLRPVSFALGLPALPGVVPPAGDGAITVQVHPRGANLAAAAGGGLAALRPCEAFIANDAGRDLVDDVALARELRVTVEQLPADLRAELRRLRLGGDAASMGAVAERLAPWAQGAGLAFERAAASDDAAETARAVAADWLLSGQSRVELLPPRRSRWDAVAERFQNKRLGTVAACAAGAAALALLIFAVQEIRVLALRSQWAAMQEQVGELQTLQDRIHAYRPWYDRSVPDLQILARVTQCFPQNGSLTARTYGAHRTDAGIAVSISGTARDGQSLLRAQENLRKAVEIEGLKVETISGKMPAQFTLSFRWIGGPNS